MTVPGSWNSRWLQASVLLYTMAVLPLGLTSAQDYEAVDRRLDEAVDNGEITQQQADTMMTTLKKVARGKDLGDVLRAVDGHAKA